MTQYTRDFWELAKKNRFPKETINYIPKYIAAKLIAKNPEKYDFKDIDYLPPIEFDSIALNKSVNLRVMADKMNYNYEDFKALNPKFKGEIAPLTNNMLDIRIPVGQKDIAIAAANESTVEKVEYIADTGDVQNYRIKRGDSLHTVARRFRTSVAYLRDLNDLSKGKKLKVGMILAVPDRTPVSERPGKTNVAATPKGQSAVVGVAEGSARYYIVQSGDSLFTIAKRYNTTVDQLKRINNIQRGKLLKVGLKLRLPGGETDNQNESKSTYNPESRLHRGQAGRAAVRGPASKTKKVVKHIVRRGENLHLIAQKYNVDYRSLKAKNKIKNPSKLFVGSMLLIPVAQASSL